MVFLSSFEERRAAPKIFFFQRPLQELLDLRKFLHPLFDNLSINHKKGNIARTVNTSIIEGRCVTHCLPWQHSLLISCYANICQYGKLPHKNPVLLVSLSFLHIHKFKWSTSIPPFIFLFTLSHCIVTLYVIPDLLVEDAPYFLFHLSYFPSFPPLYVMVLFGLCNGELCFSSLSCHLIHLWYDSPWIPFLYCHIG